MTANRYGNVLTVILMVLITVILVGLGLLTYNYVIKPKKDDIEKKEAIAEFDKEISERNEQDTNFYL